MKTKTDNTLIPRLRFPEFQNKGEWEVIELSKLCDVTKGEQLNKTELTETGKYPCLNGGIYPSGYTEKFNTPANTITISEGGNSCGYVNFMKTNFWLGGHCYKLTLKTNIEKIFLYHVLKFNEKRIMSIRVGSGLPNIQQKSLLKLKIQYTPSLPEQQKIASCLSSLDEVIAGERQRLELLKAHKKGLLQNLFPQEGETVPKLRFPEFQDSGEWEVKELGKISENFDSKRIPITENQREKGTIPYYGASGIIDYVKDYIFDETLLCISEDGANLVDRNYPIAFSIHGKTWVNNHAHVLKFDKIYTQTLVENYLNYINLEDFLTGMAQPKLNRSKLDIIPIPLPPTLEEQQKIAACLSSLDDLIQAQQQKIELLEQHKKGLLQGLFPNLKQLDNERCNYDI